MWKVGDEMELGFGGRVEMEENELEEGEAYDYQEDDGRIDPDVDLSYLDEKVQHVLGHLQKDFEGGELSAENLGAKFGGYGSFLPSQQRSPSILSHPRSPQKIQRFGTPRSPNNLPSKDSYQKSTITSSAIPPARLGPASTSVALSPVSRGLSLENLQKTDVQLSSFRGSGDVIPKHLPVNKCINSSDQKTLKVRIKMGHDNMAQKTAALYSGLGLDVSPSSSPEDSPNESGGFSPESRHSPDESPTSILQIMTSFPVPGGFLLSPLADSLLNLTEKKKLLRDGRSALTRKGIEENSSVFLDESSSVKGDWGFFGETKMKSVDRSGTSMEVKHGIVKDGDNEISALLRKEIDIETPEGRELVSNSLKLPLLSSSKFLIGDAADSIMSASDISGEGNKAVFKDKFLSSGLAEEALEPVSNQDADKIEKPNSYPGSMDKISVDRRTSFCNDAQYLPKKDGKSKANKSFDSYKVDVDGAKWKEDKVNLKSVDLRKDKVNLKSASHEQDAVKKMTKKDHSLPRGKKKSKGSQSNGNPTSEFQNESSKVASSAALKERKVTTHHSSKNNLDENKLSRESDRMTEIHRGLLGDAKMEQAENSLETPFKDKPKEKESHQFADKSKERSSSKKVNSQLIYEACPKATEIVAPPTGNGSDAVTATVAPVVIEENWVCCDKCQKWRLLPYGTNPAHLPKKWLCSMLNWLPGKNSCSISEEETTKALNALYQLPVHESQNNLQSHSDQFSTRVTFQGVQHTDQTHQDNNLSFVLSGGRKKQGLKEITNAAGHVGPMHFSSSTKKTQQQSTKSRSLNDVNQSPLEFDLTNKAVPEHSSKSSDTAAQKRKHKQKEKEKLASDEGNAKHTKIEHKRGHGQDGYRYSKKIRTEGMNHPNEDWNSDHNGTVGKAAPSSSNGFSARESGKKDVQKYSEYSSSKDAKYDANDCLPRSARKLKDPVQVSLEGGSQDARKFDKMNIVMKKRKVEEWQESQIYQRETLPNTGHYVPANEVLLEEETSGSELKKEKKAKVFKSEGKAYSTTKGNGRTEKRGQATQFPVSSDKDFIVDEMGDGKGIVKDHQLGQNREASIESQPMLVGINTVKKDVGCVHPSMAATSSSSMVSGSRKKKANAEEVKGSPVESVSSSPLRISNPDKVISARRVLLGKDDVINVGFSVTDSPRRCLDGEGDCGSDRSGTMRKEKTSDVVHCSSLDFQDRGANKTSVSRAKPHKKPSHFEYENLHMVDSGANTLNQDKQHLELLGKEHGNDDVRVKSNCNSNNGSLLQKSGKGSSSRSKDKQRSSKSDIDKGKIKASNSFSEHEELYPSKKRNEAEIESHNNSNYLEEMREIKYNLQKKHGSRPVKDEKNYTDKKDSVGSWSSEGKRENQSKLGGRDGSDIRLGATCDKNDKSHPLQNLLHDQEGHKSSYQSISDGTDPMETTSGRGKLQLLPDSGDRPEMKHRLRSLPGAHKGSGADAVLVDATGSGGDALKVTKQPRKQDKQDGDQHCTLRHSTPNGDLDGPVAVRRDSSSQAAANALKEAKDLKHSADRLKNSGLDLERTGLYFEAALKFLYGASLLEPCNVESAKYGETQSVQVYSSTASLCEFVAHEYERCKDMAAAALAYKCMEVAYLRVIYSKHAHANKDRRELQATSHMLPPGESPSSSASDVDNLNNQGTLDKVSLGKGISSPHVAGNHVIVAQSRPNFARLLNFAQDVNLAMEASRKSQNAFVAANVNLEEAQYEAVKTVLDFNFHDVQRLLHLVRVAMQSMSH